MGTDMLAARAVLAEHRLVVERVPVPQMRPGHVLIEVHAAGVCLSDVHVLDGTLPRPSGTVVTLGHEVAGLVVAVADDVDSVGIGRRVLLQAGQRAPDGRVLTRGVDYDGGWADYTLARADTVVPIPDGLPFEQAAIVPDAVSTPWAAITSVAAVRPAQAAGVWGLGGLGTHAVQLLRMVGAAPIIAVDPREPARSRARALGADVVLDPTIDDVETAVRTATGARGLDVAFDFAGVPVVREQALPLLAVRGRLVLVGLSGQPVTIPNDTWFSLQQQSVTGSFGSLPEHVLELVRLVELGRLDLSASVSDVLALHDADAAIDRLASGHGSPVRLILRPVHGSRT